MLGNKRVVLGSLSMGRALVFFLIMLAACNADAGQKTAPAPAGGEDSLFHACLRNNTGEKVFYYRKWCSGAGRCEDFKLIRIGPGEEFEHSSENWDKAIFRYQSGGEYGKWLEYTMTGSPENCQEDSTAVFVLNNHGYLRLEPVPARIKELSLSGKDVRKRVADSVNVAGDNARIFEAIEVDIIKNLNQMGIPIIIPPLVRNYSTADYRVSMNLGIAVADAISCVVMRDQEKFRQYAKIIYDYGVVLDVGAPILSKYNKISREVADGRWLNVEDLLYGLKDEITAELFKGDMKDNATLAMVCGWLEGLYVVAGSLDAEFNEEAGDLLRDRDFIRYLDEHLKKVTTGVKENDDLKALLEILPEIDRVINRPETYKYSRNDIKKIIAIYEPLRKKIVSR